MKKVWWMSIVIVIATIVIVSLIKYSFLDSETNCINSHPSSCDLSCETDNDCKFKGCICANVDEEIIEDENEKGVCSASRCECIDNKCAGVMEYCTSFEVGSLRRSSSEGISFEEDYSLSCSFQTKEECENNSIDIVGYNTEEGTFGEPDGLPDCEWVVKYPKSIWL